MYIYIYVYILYIYIYIYICVCVYRRNKKNSMCLPFFFEGVSDERFFISLGTSSQIFGPKWVNDSVPCKTVQTSR